MLEEDAGLNFYPPSQSTDDRRNAIKIGTGQIIVTNATDCRILHAALNNPRFFLDGHLPDFVPC